MIQQHHHRVLRHPARGKACPAGAFLLIFALFLPGLAPRAEAFEDIDHGALTLATTAAVTNDSDIQGTAHGNDDFIYSLYPDLLYTRDQSLLKVDVGGGVNFQRYQTYTQYDSNDADGHINFGLAPDQGLPLSGLFNVRYAETNDVDYALNERVRAKVLQSQLNGLYPIGQNISVGVIGTFNRTDRGPEGTQQNQGGGAVLDYHEFLHAVDMSLSFSRLESNASSVNGGPMIDQDSNSYSVAISRPIYDDIKGTAMYGYRFLDRSADETDTAQTSDNGPFYSVSINGPFLPPSEFPKLTSSLGVSYERATTPGIGDAGGNRLVASARLSWAATDTTRLSVTAEHTQNLASNNLTVVTTGFTGEVNQEIGHFVHATLGGGYDTEDYIGIARTDDVITGYGTLAYSATKYLQIGLSDRIRSASSDDALASFSRNVLRLYATYTF